PSALPLSRGIPGTDPAGTGMMGTPGMKPRYRPLLSPRPEGWQPPLPQWSNAQISEHYSTCIKLSAENKITTKNAFGLHLIDYMTDILKQKNSELTNFQVAAGTLDASAKIYAVRVDSVHADTFRVLGHLGKEPAPAREPHSPGEAPTKPQPKKKQNFKTIEQNLSNINAPDSGRRSEVDPMFQRAAASFDECSTAGIFLPGLRSRTFRSRLLFPSELIPLPSSDIPETPTLLAPCLEKRRICSSLAGFQFSTWDQESHNESVSALSVSALLEKFRRSEQVFDPNLDPDSEDGEGWGGPSPPEFQPDSPAGDGSQDSRDNGNSLGTLGHAGPLELSVSLALHPGEYSYFSPRTLSMWAGPQHWRFRPRRHRERPRGSRESRESGREIRVLGGKSGLRSTTLPADFNYEPRSLAQLFLKPRVTVRASGALESEAGIEDYDYDNPNDTSNFCPGLQVIPKSRNSREFLPGKSSGIPEPGNSLMDMRRLKRNMWELLTEQQEEGAGEGPDTALTEEKVLSELTRDLLHRWEQHRE
uniref:Condensin complex subunit 2 n=1 Tax=Cyanistes caeruleus TaxID=156563 RepID=A0A8C0UPJ5_CYACU